MQEKIRKQAMDTDFSGVVCAEGKEKLVMRESFGYANRTEQLKNNTDTRFGIASGCKLFTAIAICQLVEQGKLSFQSKLRECLSFEFKRFDSEVTIHHLLTHTSGIPDYFDEEEMTDFEELWVDYPMYHIRSAADFLPLFENKPMQFSPGERFHYNNAGYILLGLIVEEASEMEFTHYVNENIFNKASMERAGYYSFDMLPTNTALGYIELPDQTWKTNIYSLPVKGGPDGGAFVSVSDMSTLWRALIQHKLLSNEATKVLLSAMTHVQDNNYYGYGVWINKGSDGEVLKYHVMGYDPGVSFHSAYYPQHATIATVCSNKSEGAYEMMLGMQEEIVENK